jgi:hypothetical protein
MIQGLLAAASNPSTGFGFFTRKQTTRKHSRSHAPCHPPALVLCPEGEEHPRGTRAAKRRGRSAPRRHGREEGPRRAALALPAPNDTLTQGHLRRHHAEARAVTRLQAAAAFRGQVIALAHSGRRCSCCPFTPGVRVSPNFRVGLFGLLKVRAFRT